MIDPADGETVLYKAGDALSMDVLNDLVAHDVEEVKARSSFYHRIKRSVRKVLWLVAGLASWWMSEGCGIVATLIHRRELHQLTLRSPLRWRCFRIDITQGRPRATELWANARRVRP